MALIPPHAVHQQYGIPVRQLAGWRSQGIGPEYFTLGPRSIRYYPADIDDWLNDQTHHHQDGHADPGTPAGTSRGSTTTSGWNV
ncbi:helix-turn-helix transcriptional regulator [Arthrobacter crystallopoietes]|uniref:Helix-turn-helix domain-containing protein n=1 Tax=Crystallibacter crystallopoietes TaxID=37928 RepID=A0A1H1HW78_9MICC|nr:hypothetical protein [Arthrobacter crystallopoietes]AUI53783.1 hypothetical protein AC20117_22845 [Arthrobacter crystallopoietes]SDR29398.1 hypothetical protein SAMN04489742_4697 [Arthrobacter crystallopoietes]